MHQDRPEKPADRARHSIAVSIVFKRSISVTTLAKWRTVIAASGDGVRSTNRVSLAAEATPRRAPQIVVFPPKLSDQGRHGRRATIELPATSPVSPQQAGWRLSA